MQFIVSMQQPIIPSEHAAPAARQWGNTLLVLPVLLAVFGALILVTAGGWSLGVYGWWAFNFLIYVPLSLRGALAVLLFAYALLPRLGRHWVDWPMWDKRWQRIPLALIALL